MDVFMNVREMIGHTPILKLGNLDSDYKADIYTKLELMNPAGSVKDRVGVYMLEDARKNGLLHEGGTIVLATAGNTGIGLALAALNQGYEVIFTVPEKFSIEKQQIMAALGAKIVHTPRAEGMLGAQRRAEEIMAEIPGAISINQFTNQANPLAHFETTGPEIYKQMDGKIDYFVAGAGSGGTFTGVMKYLRSQNPNVVGVLADPVGSIIGGGEHGDQAADDAQAQQHHEDRAIALSGHILFQQPPVQQIDRAVDNDVCCKDNLRIFHIHCLGNRVRDSRHKQARQQDHQSKRRQNQVQQCKAAECFLITFHDFSSCVSAGFLRKLTSFLFFVHCRWNTASALQWNSASSVHGCR